MEGTRVKCESVVAFADDRPQPLNLNQAHGRA
jgi:hypothetical protein